MPRKSKRSISSRNSDEENYDRNANDGGLVDSDEEDDASARSGGSDDDDDDKGVMTFTSQAPEMTQDILDVRDSERNNLMQMSEHQRETAITELARLVLFKALAGKEAINRAHCIKEAGISDSRISSAAFDEVNIRLKNCFGFALCRIPRWMETMVSKTVKDRYYLINTIDDTPADFGKKLHGVHPQSAIEKGLLMTILALAYCKGDSRNNGSRWILDKDLYRLLNHLDENIPAEPAPTTSRKRGTSQQSTSGRRNTNTHTAAGVAQTPNVDNLLTKFVQRDYLLKEKASEQQQQQSVDVEETSLYYAMGPRAAIEVGRRQLIYFCSSILDEEPSPTMLQELEETQDEEMAC